MFLFGSVVDPNDQVVDVPRLRVVGGRKPDVSKHSDGMTLSTCLFVFLNELKTCDDWPKGFVVCSVKTTAHCVSE